MNNRQERLHQALRINAKHTHKKIRLGVAFLLCLLLWGCQHQSPSQRFSLPAQPTWLIRSNPGQPIPPKKYPMLVVFLTNNCTGCAKLAPTLNHIQRQFKNKITLVGIFSSSSTRKMKRAMAQQILRNYTIRFSTLYDQDGRLYKGWNIPGWPTSFLIDTHGRIVKKFFGTLPLPLLDQQLNALSQGKR